MVFAAAVAALAVATAGCTGTSNAAARGDSAAVAREEHAAFLLDRGDEALALGEWEEARRAFAGAAREGADRFSTQWGLGRAELGAGRPERALGWFESLRGEDPERFSSEALPGYCEALARALAIRLARGDDAAALAAVEGRPDEASCPGQPSLRTATAETWIRAAERSQAQGEPEEALRRLRRAQASDPRSPRPPREEARLLLRLGRVDRAIEVLDRALAVHRRDPELAALMVQALSAAGRPARGPR